MTDVGLELAAFHTTPPHFRARVQAIDAIEAWSLGFCLGNVVKYIARAGKKENESVLSDLKKAHWYLERHIKSLEEGK